MEAASAGPDLLNAWIVVLVGTVLASFLTVLGAIAGPWVAGRVRRPVDEATVVGQINQAAVTMISELRTEITRLRHELYSTQEQQGRTQVSLAATKQELADTKQELADVKVRMMKEPL